MKEKKTFSFSNNKFLWTIASFYIVLALLAPILANEKPLYMYLNGQSFFPAFSNDPYITLADSNGTITKTRVNSVDWKNLRAETKIFPFVCWSPGKSDLLNSFSSPLYKQYFKSHDSIIELPFRFRHFLGTGKTGSDVLAGLIHGTRTSLSIGLFSIFIAILLGVFTGGVSGFFGDDKIKLRRGCLIISILMIIPAWFYSFHLRSTIISDSFQSSFGYGIVQLSIGFALFALIISLPFLLRFNSIQLLNKKIFLPVDSLISGFTGIFLSLPRLILILTLAAISRPSVIAIIFIIGTTSWTEISRLMRAQVLQLREMNFIDAATTMGMRTGKIISNHLLPNIRSQLLVLMVYGTASAILVETGLSFLGIGVPAGTATWGSIMYEARENYTAWWLVVFSGVAVFGLLWALYRIAGKIDRFTD